MTDFCKRIWGETAPLREKIYALPFNRELARGTLSQDRFQFYILQDSLYLADYSRALSLAAARAPDAGDMLEFSAGAKVAIEVEQALHASYFKQFGITPANAAAQAASPTCLAYTNFLLRTALTESYGTLVAAILPCFWIYWDVGCRIAADAKGDNPYRAWIDTYADPGFGEATERVKAITDRAYGLAGEAERKAMWQAFVLSARYEWMFWDSAYAMEAWPVDVENKA